MKTYLKRIDTQTTGNRYDITPLFAHVDDFTELIDDFVTRFINLGIHYVAAIDALGFVLGTAIAQKLNVGIIVIRKGGKLPVETYNTPFIDYTHQNKELEIRKDILPQAARVLIVDEWIETGAQISAAIRLIERCNAVVVGVASISMDENEHTSEIASKYNIHTVWDGNA